MALGAASGKGETRYIRRTNTSTRAAASRKDTRKLRSYGKLRRCCQITSFSSLFFRQKHFPFPSIGLVLALIVDAPEYVTTQLDVCGFFWETKRKKKKFFAFSQCRMSRFADQKQMKAAEEP
jgi:hypothetical protein